jgi:hypothetical protein
MIARGHTPSLIRPVAVSRSSMSRGARIDIAAGGVPMFFVKSCGD